jgi:hypothetical protein
MRIALALFLAGIAFDASAQQRCLSDDTPRQCMQRLIATRAYIDAQADAAATNSGTPAVIGPIRSAVKDFLSASSAQLDGTTVKDSGTAFTIDYNLPGTLLGARRQVNLQTVVTDPALSAAVQADLASDPAKLSAATQSLGRGDDIAVALSFNPNTQRLGRSVEPHRALLDSMILAFAAGSAPAVGNVAVESFDTPFAQIVPDPAARLTAMTDFETAALAAMPAAATQIETDFGKLAANQPQLFATAVVHRRAPLVGANEREARLTWEIGNDNINSFRRAEGRDCEARGNCLTAFNDYVARRTKEHRSGRLSLAVGYVATSANDPGVATPAVVQPKSHKFTYSATYGQEIAALLTGKPTRFDITFQYDGQNKTHSVTPPATIFAARAETIPPQVLPPPRTRLSAAATVTQPLMNNLSLPMSVVWRDRTEWLPGTALPPFTISPVTPGNGRTEPFSTTDRGFEVHVGLLYHVPSFSRPPSPGKGCCCCK